MLEDARHVVVRDRRARVVLAQRCLVDGQRLAVVLQRLVVLPVVPPQHRTQVVAQARKVLVPRRVLRRLLPRRRLQRRDQEPLAHLGLHQHVEAVKADALAHGAEDHLQVLRQKRLRVLRLRVHEGVPRAVVVLKQRRHEVRHLVRRHARHKLDALARVEGAHNLVEAPSALQRHGVAPGRQDQEHGADALNLRPEDGRPKVLRQGRRPVLRVEVEVEPEVGVRVVLCPLAHDAEGRLKEVAPGVRDKHGGAPQERAPCLVHAPAQQLDVGAVALLRLGFDDALAHLLGRGVGTHLGADQLEELRQKRRAHANREQVLGHRRAHAVREQVLGHRHAVRHRAHGRVLLMGVVS